MGSRRDFFRQSALVCGATGLGTLLESIERASAIDPPAGSSFSDAQHIVILMQENRSFDHAFGSLRGVRGFHDPRAVTLPDGKPVWLQSNSAGETHGPFRLDIRKTKATWLGSLPHSWRDQTDARNHGNHNGWLDAKPSSRKECAGMPFTMGYYTREDLPFYYALADAFTICDQHFCSTLTGTTPNRLHLWTGTIREQPDAPYANVRNSDVDYPSTKSWKTFPERLEEAGVSWRVYQNELSIDSGLKGEAEAWLANFSDNPLEWFDQYHAPFHVKPGLAALGERERSLHEKAFTTNRGDPEFRKLSTLRYRDGGVEREMAAPKSDPLYQFRKDAESGKLPRVSWLVPAERFSDHPSSPWYGTWYTAEVINILTKNPDVWNKTIFILTYDENDGYFDHVPPFVVPEPGNAESGKVSAGIDAAEEYLALAEDMKRHPKDARGGPIGLGYRVPMIIASPWSRGGYVCSQVFDHTSVLQFLERVLGKGIRETNISAWRRAICGDLTWAFRPFDGKDKPLPFPGRDSALEQIHRAQFAPMPVAEGQKLPGQEAGMRSSTAIPYELAVAGSLSADGRRFGISLESRTAVFGKASAGAPFHVYTPGKYRDEDKLRARAYAVSAGDRLTGEWELSGFPDGVYHLRVHGPNGFFREFAGVSDDPQVDIQFEHAGDDIRLRVVNRGAKSLTVRTSDHGYGNGNRRITIKPNQTRVLAYKIARSYFWYDLSATIDGAPAYVRRFAGRVETGRSGFSDPAMG